MKPTFHSQDQSEYHKEIKRNTTHIIILTTISISLILFCIFIEFF